MTEETLAQGILIGIWGTTLLFSFIWYILVAISNYILFKNRLRWLEIIDSNLQSLYPTMHRLWLWKRWFILFLLIPLAGPLYGIYLVYNFGRSFGLSAVQAIFYVLLTPIFNLYIAFNDGSRYQGPQEFFID